VRAAWSCTQGQSQDQGQGQAEAGNRSQAL